MARNKKDRELIARAHAESSITDALEAELRVLQGEDDFAGALPISHRYPDFEDRDLSRFELDLRDWGFVYGLAFGLVLRDHPELPHADAARLAFRPARTVFVKWSGPIENPAEKRENAIRTLVRRYDEADRSTEDGRIVMTSQLHDAVLALTQTARG
jgi:hypothetical protein